MNDAKAEYSIRLYNRAKKNTYIGEKLAALVYVEGIGTLNRIYTCVAVYPKFARFSYQTFCGTELYECFGYTDIGYIREYHKVSNRWVRDYDAA